MNHKQMSCTYYDCDSCTGNWPTNLCDIIRMLLVPTRHIRSVTAPNAVLEEQIVTAPNAVLEEQIVTAPNTVLEEQIVTAPNVVLEEQIVTAPNAVLEEQIVTAPNTVLEEQAPTCCVIGKHVRANYSSSDLATSTYNHCSHYRVGHYSLVPSEHTNGNE